jgi:Leu/Phe-tRNA-protein transferase
MNKPRAPESIRVHLREALTKIVKGPSCESLIGPDSDDPQFVKGFRERGQREANWRSTWVETELRQVLAWMDGAETAHDIETYRNGLDYGKEPKR